MSPHIRLLDEQDLQGKTFRVGLFRNGSCHKSLWVRVDWDDDDWRIQFFESLRGAEHSWEPIKAVRLELLDLAIEGLRHAKEWILKQEAGGGE